MNRQRIAWMVTGMVLCYLVFNVPGTMAQRDDDYRFVRTLVDIYRQVGTNYVEKIEEKKLQQSAITGMLTALDPHTMYVPPDKIDDFNDALDGNFSGVGIRLNQTAENEIEVITPIDNSPAWKAGVRPGDIIIKVNGESVVGNRLDDVIPKIKGTTGTSVTLTVKRDKIDSLDLTMLRQEFVVPMTKGYSRNQDNSWNFWVDEKEKIAYVRLTQFTPNCGEAISQIMNQLIKEGMKGLIFDLRFNPGGRLEEAEQIIDLFVKEGLIVSVKGRNRPEQKVYAKANGTLPDFPMVVLVNEHSASASEVVAGGLKDTNRAVVVGTRTYGKGSVQEVLPLDANSGELKLTVAYWYLPSGKLVQKLKDAKEWGVEPNEVVEMSEDQQIAVAEAQLKAERMYIATLPSATMPATTQSTTHPTSAPTTQAVDLQLEKAVAVIRAKVTELK